MHEKFLKCYTTTYRVVSARQLGLWCRQVCRQETETQQLRLSEEQAAVDREETERRDREDRQRREVAEEERREAEEQRRLEDDERLRKEDPKHWPTIVYVSQYSTAAPYCRSEQSVMLFVV